MLTEQDIENLPDDPDWALAVIADLLIEQVGPTMNNEDFGIAAATAWYSDVKAHIVVHELGFRYPGLLDDPPGDQGMFWQWWTRYSADLRQVRTMIYMEKKRNASTVIITPAKRKDIHELLNQIRELVEKLDVTEAKRNLIFKLIARLQAEVDQTRTGVQTMLNTLLEVSRVAKEVGENAKPIVDRMREIFGIFADSESGSSGPVIGRDRTPRIENRSRRPKSGKAELDDDIPF